MSRLVTFVARGGALVRREEISKEPEKQETSEKDKEKGKEQPRKPYNASHLTNFGEVEEFTDQITGIG